jgi:calcineurin-like phosphoesterase family protein
MNFFTSDLHFGHKNIVTYTNRGKVIPEGVSHTQWLMDIWKKQVRPTDTVYHLGDFAFLHQKKSIQLLTELPGNKVLIHGNHDSDKFRKAVKDVPNISSYFYKEIKIQEVPTILFHFPIEIWHKQHHGSYHLHGHCVDMQTELLTATGWKKFGEFSVNDKVPTYNTKTDSIEYQKILRIFNPVYSGNVYTLKGKSANGRFTEDHRLIGYNYKNRYSEFAPKTIPKSPFKLIHSAKSNNKVKLQLSDEQLRLYVYCTADGSLKKETGLWRIKVKKQHKKVELLRVLSALNLEYNRYDTEEYSSFNFYFDTGLNPKGLDPTLREMNDEQFKIFIDAYSLSDGSRNGRGVIITTAKEQEADLIQELAVTHGWSCTVSSRIGHGFSKQKSWNISVYPRTLTQCKSVKYMQVETVTNEPFWCIKTTNGNFFIRREGKVHVTGNCHGNFVKEHGFILDVGIDSAYNLYGEHRFFTEADIVAYMSKRTKTPPKDHHDDKIENQRGFLRASIAEVERQITELPPNSGISLFFMRQHLDRLLEELKSLN